MDAAKKMWIILAAIMVLFELYYSLFPIPAATEAIRFFAMAGFLMLCTSLLIGPLTVLNPKKFGILIKERRAVGVIAFLLILAHFILVFALAYNYNPAFLFSTFSIIIGTPAMIILFLLAFTSFDKAIRKMGFGKWKLLQRFTYLAFILSFIHFVLNLNGYFVLLPTGEVFVNIAEIILILLGIITIIAQFIGFYAKRKAGKTEPKQQ